MTTLLENNQVKLLGYMASDDFTFSHEVKGEKFYTFTLEVERKSSTKDYIPVIISEKLIDKKQNYIGKPVCILGQYRSFNQKDNKSTHLLLYVFATSFYISEAIDYVNDVHINGFICKQPNYRTTPAGRQITDVLIAIPRRYGKSDYIPCICWGRDAVYVSQLNIGKQLVLTGRIQSREYRKQTEVNIENRTAYEVSIGMIEEV